MANKIQVRAEAQTSPPHSNNLFTRESLCLSQKAAEYSKKRSCLCSRLESVFSLPSSKSCLRGNHENGRSSCFVQKRCGVYKREKYTFVAVRCLSSVCALVLQYEKTMEDLQEMETKIQTWTAFTKDNPTPSIHTSLVVMAPLVPKRFAGFAIPKDISDATVASIKLLWALHHPEDVANSIPWNLHQNCMIW